MFSILFFPPVFFFLFLHFLFTRPPNIEFYRKRRYTLALDVLFFSNILSLFRVFLNQRWLLSQGRAGVRVTFFLRATSRDSLSSLLLYVDSFTSFSILLLSFFIIHFSSVFYAFPLCVFICCSFLFVWHRVDSGRRSWLTDRRFRCLLSYCWSKNNAKYVFRFWRVP